MYVKEKENKLIIYFDMDWVESLNDLLEFKNNFMDM